MNTSKMSWSDASAKGISRLAWLSSVRKKSSRNRSRISRKFLAYECCHRGKEVGTVPCRTCGGSGTAKVHNCRLYETCTIKKSTKHPLCQTCPSRQRELVDLPFADYSGSRSGECYVFGSGKTDFDYDTIPAITEPMYFINQAAQLADRATIRDLFMIALDKKQNIYFKDFPGTLLLPQSPNMGDSIGAKPEAFKEMGRICWWSNAGFKQGSLNLNQSILRETTELYQAPKGFSASIMPLLHFIWYSGFSKVNMIGCSGGRDGYDERLENRTNQRFKLDCDPGGSRFESFRSHQDEVAEKLGLELLYL